MHYLMRSTAAITFVAAVLLGLCEAQSGPIDVPEPNPGRPTISTPATLTPVGYLQFETGLLLARASPEFSGRIGLGETIKLAVHPRFEFLLQAEPLAYASSAAPDKTHEGEAFAGVQTVILQGEGIRPTISMSYLQRFHEGVAPELDIGTTRQTGLLLISEDVHGFHADLNAIVGEQAAAVRRAQFGQTLSVSHRIGKFTVSGEVWHFTQPLIRSNAVGNLWALAYPIRKNLVVDGGFDRGLTVTSTHWEAFCGFTYLLPSHLTK
jgi:hypothetical protein